MKFPTPLLALVSCLCLLASCDKKDPIPTPCIPNAVIVGNDSIVLAFDDQRRIKTIYYYSFGVNLTKQDEFFYNEKGQLNVIDKYTVIYGQDNTLNTKHLIYYNQASIPTKLQTISTTFGEVITEFTHNEAGQLLVAKTTVYGDFIGSTRYEYDQAGNIPKVYYTLALNGRLVEVLARENLSFDDKQRFYENSKEFRICNEYVYAYLPNRNNCLSAKVYYYNYNQRFSNPLSVSFDAQYDDTGMISSLKNTTSADQLYSGDVLFRKVIYKCD